LFIFFLLHGYNRASVMSITILSN